MGKKVLICTNAIIPLPGQPVTGAGLRAWSLGEGMRHHGWEVHYAMPQTALDGVEDVPESLRACAFAEGALVEVVSVTSPDVLVVAQWPLLAELPELEIPVVLDCHAPHLLRTTFTRGSTPEDGAARKITAIQKADALLIAGERQRAYVQAWQLQAGVKTEEQPLLIVPPALSPELPEPVDTDDDPVRMVYGGPLWPWLDPQPGLSKAVEVLHGRGTLEVCAREPGPLTSAITQWPAAANERLRARLGTRAHVNWHGLLDHAAWRALCHGASLAFDLHQDHAERAIAYPMRTIEYLWHGVPVIHSRFSPLAPLIQQYHAGWIGDPANADGLRQVLGRIVADPGQLAAAAHNARILAAEHFTWDHATQALAAFAAQPKRRAKRMEAVVSAKEVEALRDALATAEASLSGLETQHAEEVQKLRAQAEDEARKRQEAMDQFQSQLTGLIRPQERETASAAAAPASEADAAQELLGALTAEITMLREQEAAWETERRALTDGRDALHDQVTETVAEYDEAMARWTREKAALETERDALRAQLDASVPRDEVNALRAQLDASVPRDEANELRTRLDASVPREEVNELRARMQDTEAALAKAEDRAEAAELKCAELEQLVTDTAKDLEAAHAEAETLRAAKSARELEFTALETELAESHAEFAQFREALTRAAQERDESRESLDVLRTELEQLRDIDARTEAVAVGLAETKTTLEEEVARLSDELNQAADAHTSLTRALEEIETELARVREESAQARRAKEAAEARAATLERDMTETAQEIARRSRGGHDWPERQEVMQAKLDRLTRELAEAQSARKTLQVELESQRTEQQLSMARNTPADDAAHREWAEERAALTRALENARMELAEVYDAHQRDRVAWRDTKQALAERLKQLISESTSFPSAGG
jgi:chromosome segregation ATPase